MAKLKRESTPNCCRRVVESHSFIWSNIIIFSHPPLINNCNTVYLELSKSPEFDFYWKILSAIRVPTVRFKSGNKLFPIHYIFIDCAKFSPSELYVLFYFLLPATSFFFLFFFLFLILNLTPNHVQVNICLVKKSPFKVTQYLGVKR